VYDKLFTVPEPDAVGEGQEFTDTLNPDSAGRHPARQDRAERGR